MRFFKQVNLKQLVLPVALAGAVAVGIAEPSFAVGVVDTNIDNGVANLGAISGGVDSFADAMVIVGGVLIGLVMSVAGVKAGFKLWKKISSAA